MQHLDPIEHLAAVVDERLACADQPPTVADFIRLLLALEAVLHEPPRNSDLDPED